jgi:eukaryotic-like serine/threonine-protein kinase
MNELIGSTVAQRFQVVQFIGRGGMAEVYKVWDIQRSVHLAMKVLREDLAEDEIFLRRFRREAETLSRLQHPNIIRSYGLVQTDQLAFLLMDFIDGTTLRKEIFYRKQAWPLEQVISVMRPVCAALNYAHTQGLVHCDVKPANIMLTGAGKVFMADFGIARLTESATTATMVGAGTPAYMAPEQIRGVEDPCPQTDLYALGIVLFELVTGGERPFTGEHAQTTGSGSEKVRWEQEHSTPPSVRLFNPAVSTEIETIIFKCLEKDPTRRYSSAMELLSALEKAYPVQSSAGAAAWNISISTSSVETPPYPAPSNPTAGGFTPPGYPPVPPQYPPLPEAVPAPSARRSLPWWVFVMIAAVLFLGVFALSKPPASPTPAPPQAYNPASTGQPAATSSIASAGTTSQPGSGPTSTQPLATNRPTSTQPQTTTRPSPTRPLPTATKAGSPACTGINQTWKRTKDNAAMVCVPAGAFVMGLQNCRDAWCQSVAAQGDVNVAAFWIDQYEVTNNQYQQFVADTGFTTGAEDSGGSMVYPNVQPVPGANWRSPQGAGSSIAGKGDNPVVQMNFFSAAAYCQWAGGRLPTEAQWEKAARGTDGRMFPWGNDAPNQSLLNAAGQNDGFRYTSPVGSFPDGRSPYGLFDMAGNAFEWTRSLLKDYPYKASDGREIETQPGNGAVIALRGGGFYADLGSVGSTLRAAQVAQNASDATGFRCVVDR